MKKSIFGLAILAMSLVMLPQSFAQPLTLSSGITTATIANIQAGYYHSKKSELNLSCDEDSDSKAFDFHDAFYCLTGEPSTEIREVNGIWYLFLKFNADFSQAAGHATSGLGGLFIFRENKHNQWQLVAKNPYIENGQWGESQLKDFNLVKIGSQKYGWAGEFFGSGAGGESNSDWTLFAPIGNKIEQVVSEEVAHDYAGGHWVETVGKVTILSNRPEVNGYYPIQVTRTTKTALTNDDLEPIKNTIKTQKQSYILVFNGKQFIKGK